MFSYINNFAGSKLPALAYFYSYKEGWVYDILQSNTFLLIHKNIFIIFLKYYFSFLIWINDNYKRYSFVIKPIVMVLK